MKGLCASNCNHRGVCRLVQKFLLRPEHSFLHWHRVSSWHDLAIAGRSIHCGSQVLSLWCYPKWIGLGKTGLHKSDRPHICPAWNARSLAVFFQSSMLVEYIHMIAAFLQTSPVVPHSLPCRNYFYRTWVLQTPRWFACLHQLLQQVLNLIWWRPGISSQTRSMSAMLTVHGRTKLYRIHWMHERTWWLWSHSNFMNWDLYVVLPLSKVNPQIFQAKWTSEIIIITVTYPFREGNSVFSAQPSWFAAHKERVSN